MVTFRDSVIAALLRRMGGPQYLEWDELEGIERPQFVTEEKYLVVRPAGDEEERPGSCTTSHENGTGSQSDAPPSRVNRSCHDIVADISDWQ